MNIIEAANTGKRIRRQSWRGEGGWYRFCFGTLSREDLSREDIIATDWEVEETHITLTRAQFEAAFQRAVVGDPWQRQMLEKLARELGFGDGEK